MAEHDDGQATDHGAEPPDHPLERLIFFSDAVFAIAITLLIIEVHPPHLHYGAPWQDYVQALLGVFPSLFGFFVSFFVIGAFWSAHHRTFALAGRFSERLIAPNLQLLCAIVFVPFATAFMSANAGTLVPSICYALTLIATGLLQRRLARVVTAPDILRPGLSPERIASVRVRGGGVVLGALVSIAIAFIWAPVSQVGLMTVPVFQRLLWRRVRRRLDATTGD